MRRDPVGGPPCGFTLIEVMIALTVGAIVLLAARSTLETLADQARWIGQHAAAADDRTNSERDLRTLIDQVETAVADTAQFAGDERSLRFSTWCTVPAGWQERCTASVAIASDSAGQAVSFRTTVSAPQYLRRGVRNGALRYLVSPANGGEWLSDWHVAGNVPLAVGIIVERDTLFLRIGHRG